MFFISGDFYPINIDPFSFKKLIYEIKESPDKIEDCKNLFPCEFFLLYSKFVN